METAPPEINKWFDLDPYLIRYRQSIVERYLRFVYFRSKLTPNDSLDYATKAHHFFGIHVDKWTGVATVREWAPGAKALYFAGDFNSWDRSSHPFTKLDDGIWELIIPPNDDGNCVLRHLSEIKIVVETVDGVKIDRLSPWATYVEASRIPDDTQYRQKFWYPPNNKIYQFFCPKPNRPRSLRIYECHIGIATGSIQFGREVGTYRQFSNKILPRIKKNGYNAIQLMAIQEHPYYASFGYQVTSFFAVSSRYGTPEELKELVDKAHSMGIFVILDIVHSHASSNINDGLNEFDGTKGCFFYNDSRGYHSQWGSRMFNTNNIMVLRFLISNACWFVDEYNFDGFRFDGITAMMYKSRGIDQTFTGNYDEYFGDLVDPNGILYCQLINYFLQKCYKNIITIAEEVSGMPGMCRPSTEGGLGFDYRLAMAIPDKWIQLLKTKQDEQWDMGDLVWTHSNRRHKENSVAYCESHDQALVGDKTISFWLMDAAMYNHMKRTAVLKTSIDRGIALHKMIRLFTHSLGGEAYMNFIGNEFGHPEWLDFPRAGNAWSYHFCRRQWKLVDDENLLYYNLNEFDKAMNWTEDVYGWLSSREAYVSLKHEDDKVVVFERANLVFVFNFHVTKSFSNYKVGVNLAGEYECILSTDDDLFAGHNRVDCSIHYFTSPNPYCNRNNSMLIYIPNRAAIVLAPVSEAANKKRQFMKLMYKTIADIVVYADAKMHHMDALDEETVGEVYDYKDKTKKGEALALQVQEQTKSAVELVKKPGTTLITEKLQVDDLSPKAAVAASNLEAVSKKSDSSIEGPTVFPNLIGRVLTDLEVIMAHRGSEAENKKPNVGEKDTEECVADDQMETGSSSTNVQQQYSESIFYGASSSTIYETPASSHYEMFKTISDVVTDVSLWTASSTTLFSSEEFQSVLEGVRDAERKSSDDTISDS